MNTTNETTRETPTPPPHITLPETFGTSELPALASNALAAARDADALRRAAEREAAEIIVDARRERDAMLQLARQEADRIVERARESAAMTVAAATEPDRTETVDSLGHRLPERPRATPVHSREIAARVFPRRFRGLDDRAVREWLEVVESSQASLERELDRLRWSWDELLVTVARTRAAAIEPGSTDPWRSLARSISVGRPDPHLVAPHTGPIRDALAGAVRGRRAIRAALAEATAHLTRLQHEHAVVLGSNEQLRSQLIQTLVEGSAR